MGPTNNTTVSSTPRHFFSHEDFKRNVPCLPQTGRPHYLSRRTWSQPGAFCASHGPSHMASPQKSLCQKTNSSLNADPLSPGPFYFTSLWFFFFLRLFSSAPTTPLPSPSQQGLPSRLGPVEAYSLSSRSRKLDF